jgi:hypothetical protein
MLLQWSRPARVALLSSTAVACTLVGMLLGVLAAGSHVTQVLRSIESPAAAHAGTDRPRTNRIVTRSHTVVQTRTVTQPSSTVTVTQPAQTVTVTETAPAPTTTPTSTSPAGGG